MPGKETLYTERMSLNLPDGWLSRLRRAASKGPGKWVANRGRAAAHRSLARMMRGRK